MSEKITFKELVELIAKQSEQSQSSANSFISELVDIIETGLKSDGQVSISGFGKFELRWMKERAGTNPQTGEKITIPGQNKVVFKPFKALREGVNAPYAHLDTTVIGEQSGEKEKASKEVIPPPVQSKSSEVSIDDLIIERDSPLKRQKKEPVEQAAATTVASSMKPNPKLVKEVQDKGTFNWSFAAAGIIALLAFLLLFYIVQRSPVSDDPQVTDQIEMPALPDNGTVTATEPADDPALAADDPELSEEEPELQGRDEAEFTEEDAPEQAELEIEEVQIQPGQSLWTIAETELGNPYLWPLLYHLNQDLIDNPNEIPVAGELQVPVISDPDNLTEFEREQVARGYLSLYDWNRENNPDEARFFLWAVGVFSTDLLENLPTEVDSEDLAFAVSR